MQFQRSCALRTRYLPKPSDQHCRIKCLGAKANLVWMGIVSQDYHGNDLRGNEKSLLPWAMFWVVPRR